MTENDHLMVEAIAEFVDVGFYNAQLDAPLAMASVLHYVRIGWKAGLDPSADFSTEGYLSANPDVRRAGINPLVHFVQHGRAEGRDPGKAPKVAAGAEDGLSAEIALISSGFDARFYLRANPDVARAGVDPLRHYSTVGWREGRLPNAEFNNASYFRLHPELRQSGENPFYHYLRTRGEGEEELPTNAAYKPKIAMTQKALLHRYIDREHYISQLAPGQTPLDLSAHYLDRKGPPLIEPHPGFSPKFYEQTYPDISEDDDCFLHYLELGHLEGRAPNSAAHARAVGDCDPLTDDDRDLRTAGAIAGEVDGEFYQARYGIPADDAARHYASKGWRKAWDPSPAFSTQKYLADNPDVAAADINPLLHHVVNRDVLGTGKSPAFANADYYLARAARNEGLCDNELGRLADMSWEASFRALGQISRQLAKGQPHPLVPDLDLAPAHMFLQAHNLRAVPEQVAFSALFQFMGIQNLVANKLADSPAAELQSRVRVINRDLLEAALRGDRPVFLIGSHVGVGWMCIAALSHLGVPMLNVGHGPLTAHMAVHYRHLASKGMFPAAVFKACDEALAAKTHLVHILPDVWKGAGRNLPFLGRDHHFAEGFCHLAHKRNPLLLTYSNRLGMDGTLEIEFGHALGEVPRGVGLADTTAVLLDRYRDWVETLWLDSGGAINIKYLETFFNRLPLTPSREGA